MKLQFVRFKESVRIGGGAEASSISLRKGPDPSTGVTEIEVKGPWLLITSPKGVTLTAVANVRDAEPAAEG